MSWFAVGAEIGGLAECLFFILGPLAMMYNQKFKMASLISKFLFTKDGKPIRLKSKDILCSCFYKKSLFEQGRHKV